MNNFSTVTFKKARIDQSVQRLGNRMTDSPISEEAEILLIRLYLKPNHPSFHTVPWALSQGAKQPGHKADRQPLVSRSRT